MLRNEYVFLKVAFDTAENEPSKSWQLRQMLINYNDGVDFPQGRPDPKFVSKQLQLLTKHFLECFSEKLVFVTSKLLK